MAQAKWKHRQKQSIEKSKAKNSHVFVAVNFIVDVIGAADDFFFQLVSNVRYLMRYYRTETNNEKWDERTIEMQKEIACTQSREMLW